MRADILVAFALGAGSVLATLALRDRQQAADMVSCNGTMTELSQDIPGDSDSLAFGFTGRGR